MDDQEADFRIAWLHDDDAHKFDGFSPEYAAEVEAEEERKFQAFLEYQRTQYGGPDPVTGPDACRICKGEGFTVERYEPYPEAHTVPCHACAGTGRRASITPAVAEYTGQMLAQMKERLT